MPTAPKPSRLRSTSPAVLLILLFLMLIHWPHALAVEAELGRGNDQQPEETSQLPAPLIDGSNASGQTLLREGTKLAQQQGTFQLAGDRLTFTMKNPEHRLMGLENLNLERIAQTLLDNPGATQWTISGTVTEYRGANYLLVTRAILNARVDTDPLLP